MGILSPFSLDTLPNAFLWKFASSLQMSSPGFVTSIPSPLLLRLASQPPQASMWRLFPLAMRSAAVLANTPPSGPAPVHPTRALPLGYGAALDVVLLWMECGPRVGGIPSPYHYREIKAAMRAAWNTHKRSRLLAPNSGFRSQIQGEAMLKSPDLFFPVRSLACCPGNWWSFQNLFTFCNSA